MARAATIQRKHELTPNLNHEIFNNFTYHDSTNLNSAIFPIPNHKISHRDPAILDTMEIVPIYPP